MGLRHDWGKWMHEFLADPQGASSVEYALLVTGIAVVIISAVALFGKVVNASLTSSNTRLWQ